MDAEELAMELGGQKKAVQFHEETFEVIFRKLDAIKEVVDKNEVRAGYRDTQLAELKVGIAEVDRKIENGLRKEVKETKAQMEKMTACVERRRKEKEVEDQRGVYGFFRRGLVQFRDRGSYIVVTSLIVGSAFIIIWVAAQVLIFHETSGLRILKLFGVG